jgi:hypothetical protein
VSTLPGSNIAHEFRAEPWRTGTSTAAENIVIDLGSAQAVTAVILLDHTLTAGDSGITLEGNSANSWGAPAFSQALTWASGTISATFSTQTYRYWRIKFTKSSSSEARDIGRVFLGTYLEPTDLPDYDGYSETLEDLSRKTKVPSGQTWTEDRDQFSTVSVTLSRFGQTDVDNLKTMFDTIGQSKSLFFQCSTSSPLNKVWYVKFRRPYSRDVVAYASEYKWDLDLEMEEQL